MQEKAVSSCIDILRQVKRQGPGFRIELEHMGRRYVLSPPKIDAGQTDPDEVRCLTQWRNRYVDHFLTEFTATQARTANWLTGHVARDDTRLLFLLRDEKGAVSAYLGIAFINWQEKKAEADAVVKGVELPKGTMRAALQALLRWAGESLGIRHFGVRVLEDNPAVEFYHRCGFVEQRREPLVVETTADGRRWRSAAPGEQAQRRLVHMDYTGSTDERR